MPEVLEYLEVFPFHAEPRVLRRREDLLLGDPLPGRMRAPREYPPIEAAFFAPDYVDQPFVPPRGVYESESVRIEWQTMNARQPFYHRNCGVDEISFQVCGDRTIMTELGSVDVAPGEFALLPDGVAHDNYGRRDIHLLFYVPGPVRRLAPVDRRSEARIPPFPGWSAAVVNELVTEGAGGPGQDVAFAPVDEQMLLAHADEVQDRLEVLRPDARSSGTAWLYQSAEIMIGQVAVHGSEGTVYRRLCNAEEIQYQVAGTRTLVTQRGALHLKPGDFVRIPRAVAFTSIHAEPSVHLTLASTRPIPCVARDKRAAVRMRPDEIDALRGSGRKKNGEPQ
ncbi:MAG: hypothetical protein QHC78_10495 [Pigmentiphaga sp.]|uniref:hypothetical protein n=1 Tax=Pigmentiphaga sp. TaxID=1977564 RepID=UPI0029B9BA1C|nr:hypothetical protein [Pigmentiphaga sp.]MDX3906104.1 hypothetical protein [Pigmentiphaga sp.]